ncbi:hypothetical protein EI94DRAFT_1714772 [Lactarius quietus]|nr:hypothetical protein EI94DRAFT_1714772 [Lactarius quietus]
MSFASSSSLSHHRSDLTSDFSPASSPLLSPTTSGRHLSRLTVESDRVLPRDPFHTFPISPQSFRSGWDEGSCIVTSPSSVTLTDMNPAPPRPKTRPRGFTDVRPSTASGPEYSASDQNAPRVIVRQPSATKILSLRPPTAPPDIGLPPAPESARRDEFSLLPAFPEHALQSPASSSSSLSFASSASSKFDARDNYGKITKSRPSSPLKDRGRNVRDSPSKASTSRREFSPTRTLKKAISIQNLPKRCQGNSVPHEAAKKQRSFHHTRLMPTFPLKQANSSSISPGRDGTPVPDDRRDIVQPSPKLPITPPVSSPRVRERLFSGSGSRRHASPQSPGPDDERQSILSSPSATSPHTRRPHTAIPVNQSPVSNRPELSSFWDEETLKGSPATGSESQDYGPQQILSAADILKFENMVRDGENLSEFVRSRENSITSVAASRHSGHPASEPATTGGSLSSCPITRRQDFTNGRDVISDRPRTRGNSLQGKRRFHEPSTPRTESVSLLGAGDRSSVILHPLSPPPVRRNPARRIRDPPSPPVT